MPKMEFEMEVSDEQFDAMQRQKEYEAALGIDPYEVRLARAMQEGDERAQQFAWKGGEGA